MLPVGSSTQPTEELGDPPPVSVLLPPSSVKVFVLCMAGTFLLAATVLMAQAVEAAVLYYTHKAGPLVIQFVLDRGCTGHCAEVMTDSPILMLM